MAWKKVPKYECPVCGQSRTEGYEFPKSGKIGKVCKPCTFAKSKESRAKKAAEAAKAEPKKSAPAEKEVAA